MVHLIKMPEMMYRSKVVIYCTVERNGVGYICLLWVCVCLVLCVVMYLNAHNTTLLHSTR